MSFIQPCFIRKNTLEIIHKLKDLGYRCCSTFSEKAPYIFTGEYVIYDTFNDNLENIKIGEIEAPYGICCGDNEELFLALAALRDDTDKNQYWICDKVSMSLGKSYYPDDYIYYQYDEFFDKQNWHKLTVEELIEHFKFK